MLTKYLGPEVSGPMVYILVTSGYNVSGSGPGKGTCSVGTLCSQGGGWQLGSPAPVLVIIRQMKYDVQSSGQHQP